MKKILSTILMVCMVMLTIGNTVFAVNQSNENSDAISVKDAIIKDYYNSNTLDYVDVYKPNPIEVRYSPKFNNFDWRKNYAVIGYLNSYIYWDSAGDVEYEHGNVVVIRHRHNF